MSAVAEKTTYTPDDLLAMADEKDYELVDGRLVERNMGALSSWVGCRIAFLLAAFLEENPIGLLFNSENGYQCFPDSPKTLRKPDVSFVRHGRLPNDFPPSGWVSVAPDLAVEVVSPNDLASEVIQKINEYLRAGVRLVWVINPDDRSVFTFAPEGPNGRLVGDAELTGGDVLPGFRCRVPALFPTPAAPAPAAGA